MSDRLKEQQHLLHLELPVGLALLLLLAQLQYLEPLEVRLRRRVLAHLASLVSLALRLRLVFLLLLALLLLLAHLHCLVLRLRLVLLVSLATRALRVHLVLLLLLAHLHCLVILSPLYHLEPLEDQAHPVLPADRLDRLTLEDQV